MKGTLLLLLTVAVLAGALWWSEREESAQVDVGPVPEPALQGEGLYDAVHVRLAGSADATPIEFAREPGAPWRMVEPVRDVVSRARLEAVFDAFGASELIPYALTEEELTDQRVAEMGLDEPRAFLEARWPDGREVRFEIGLEGPFGSDLFVRRDGVIWRGELGLYTALQGVPDDWRERFVFAHQAPEARTMILDRALGGDELPAGSAPRPRERLVLRRQGAEGWRLVEPFDLRLDPGRAETLVGALLGLQVGSFLSGRPGEATSGPIDPDAKADVELEVQGARGVERVSLTRLEGLGQFLGHAESRQLWFLVDSPPYAQAVEVPLQQVRAQYLLTRPVDEAGGVRITGPAGEVVELVREAGGAFRLARPVAMAADPTASNELLGAIRRMYTIRFVEDDAEDLARYGLDPEHRTLVELLGRRNRVQDALQLGGEAAPPPGQEAAPGVYVKRADEPHVVQVEQAAVELLRRPWTAYVDREVVRLDSGGRVQEIVCNSGGEELRLVRESGQMFRLAGADEVDPELVEVADRLRDLRAEGAVDAAEVIGDREPDAVVQLIGPSGTTVAELRLYDRPEGNSYCVRARNPEIAYELGHLTTRMLRLLRPE